MKFISSASTFAVAIISTLLAGQAYAFTYGLLLPEYLYNHKGTLPISLGGVILKFVEPVGQTVAGYHNSNVTTAGVNIINITVSDMAGKPVKVLKLNTKYNLTLTSSPNGIVDLAVNIDGTLMWGQDWNGNKVGQFLSFPNVFSYYPYAVKKQGIVHNQVLSNNATVTSIIYKTPKKLCGNVIRLGGLGVTDSQFGFFGGNFTVAHSSSSHSSCHSSSSHSSYHHSSHSGSSDSSSSDSSSSSSYSSSSDSSSSSSYSSSSDSSSSSSSSSSSDPSSSSSDPSSSSSDPSSSSSSSSSDPSSSPSSSPGATSFGGASHF